MNSEKPRPSASSIWTKLWLGWLLVFLLIEIPAAFFTQGAAGTLSVTTWVLWFPGASVVLVVAFVLILAGHFLTRGRYWWSSGRAIVAGAVPVILTILWREGMLKKVWGGLKGGFSWTLRRGPVISSLLTGVALVVPQAAPILRIIAGLVAGGTGADQQTVEGTAELVNGALLAVGALRKFWSLAKAFWPKLQAGGTAGGTDPA